MKRTLKKAMSILLAVVMIFGTVASIGSFDLAIKAEAATSGTCGENLTWTFDESTGILTISGTGDMIDFFYADDAPWYSYTHNGKVKSIIINSGVTSIGRDAFPYCLSVTNVSIPEGLIHIGEYAFMGNVCLEDVYIPNSLKSIGSAAFYDSGITSISIPAGLTSIGDKAFFSCNNLSSITVDNSNTVYSSDEFGVLFNKDKTELMQYPTGNTRAGYIVSDSVTKICKRAFYSCEYLTDITVGDSVTNIGTETFKYCDALSSVIIGKKVTSIGKEAFIYCHKLVNVTIPVSVTYIGSSAFDYCSELSDVYYGATEKEWNKIEISQYNDPLLNATIHYNEDYVYTDTDESTTEPTTILEETTKPSTTKPVDELTTVPLTNSAVTEPSYTKPVEVLTTEPATTKPFEEPVTEPSTEPATEPSITKPYVEEEIIRKPSTTEVKYGETLILHADFTNVPEGATIEWSVEGEGVTIKPSADGKTCAVTSTATGEVTVTAKYVDANGVEHISEQKIESNASVWQKIVSFFKNLFGMNRIIEQAVKFDR